MKINLPKELSKEELVLLIKDPHPMPPPDFFPLGVFWITLGIAVISYLAYKFVISRTKRISIKYLAGREFTRAYEEYIRSDDLLAFAKKLARLLRRVGIQAYGYEAVSGLHGESWMTFIKEHSQQSTITPTILETIVKATYADTVSRELDAEEAYQQTYKWAMEQLW